MSTPHILDFPAISGVSCIKVSMSRYIYKLQDKHTGSTFFFFWNDKFLCCYHLSTGGSPGISLPTLLHVFLFFFFLVLYSFSPFSSLLLALLPSIFLLPLSFYQSHNALLPFLLLSPLKLTEPSSSSFESYSQQDSTSNPPLGNYSTYLLIF